MYNEFLLSFINFLILNEFLEIYYYKIKNLYLNFWFLMKIYLWILNFKYNNKIIKNDLKFWGWWVFWWFIWERKHIVHEHRGFSSNRIKSF